MHILLNFSRTKRRMPDPAHLADELAHMEQNKATLFALLIEHIQVFLDVWTFDLFVLL